MSLRIRKSHILELHWYYEKDLRVNVFADAAILGPEKYVI